MNEKLASIWSDRREMQIAIRICYTVQHDGACKIYTLEKWEELAE